VAVPDDIPKDFKKPCKKAEEQGFSFQKTKKGYRVLAPNGKQAVQIHKTPGHNAVRHFLADMRRLGYKD
jgi:hypothetical protein